MRLSELIEVLQDFQTRVGDEVDPEIRVAFQPSYPLAAELDAVTLMHGYRDVGDVVFLAASASVPYNENPYAPSAAWDGEEVTCES